MPAENPATPKAIPSTFGAPPHVQKDKGARAASTAAAPTASPSALPRLQRDTAAANPMMASPYAKAWPASPASRQSSPPRSWSSAVSAGWPTG